MSYTDLLNILQIGEVELDPPGGKIRLYDGRVVEPLGSYTFTVSLNSGSQCNISFDILEKAPWAHRRWQHMHQAGLDISRIRPVPSFLNQ